MPNEKNRSCEVTFTVPFHDLDPMQMVWHGNYLKYFDVTRSKLFAEAGIDLPAYYQQTGILFPIIKTSTKHILPLRYMDEFVCRAIVVEAQYKIVMEFKLNAPKDSRIYAKGRSEQVAALYPQNEIMFEIPQDIRQAIGC
jgi:acyl-CoA thioester hydrolase